VKIRYKLAGAPLRYTLALVSQGIEAFESFHGMIWSADGQVPARTKELAFLRCSIVSRCPT